MDDKDFIERDPEWETSEAQTEIKKIRKSIRKRNTLIILTSLVLVAALLAGTVYGIIPAIESAYWNPTDSSFETQVPDLTLTLQAYTELFQPGWKFSSVAFGRTGFAAYDLAITRYDTARSEYAYMYGSLIKGELGVELPFTREGAAMDLFGLATYPYYPMEESERKATLEKLSQLPEYVTVEAAITFADDMNMDDVLSFRNQYQLPITWVGIRNAPMDEQKLLLCGIDPFSGGAVHAGVNEKYPYLSVELAYSGEILEQHFKSLLQFSSDQLEAGRGMQVYGGDRNYYAEVLDYVEENGVYSYGCVVFTTPQKLLELLENEQVSQIKLMDAWLDV